MREQPTAEILAGPPDTHRWTPECDFEDFVELCGCGMPHLSLLTDPNSFSTTLRGGRVGPAALKDIVVGADTSIDCGEECEAYRVFLVRSGRAAGAHRGLFAGGIAGSAAVYPPEGLAGLQWDAGSEILLFKMDRSAVEDALSDALGRPVTSQPDFAPLMPADTAAARSWLNMVTMFAEQFFHPDGLIHQPLVGLPFVDSLVRGFLLAADHSLRNALAGQEHSVAPRAIQTAIDVIQAEAHLPLTLSSIAARSQVSVRSLQQGFKRHVGTSPMSYLRDVRLRRAHQTLLESDPSTVTVSSVAYGWGFTNLGRFAAAHAARYREQPAKTLRRTA
ncbi:MAG TPA: AraC family transcriptional regulator [Mycobacterium sp.]|nr:AraC family transcriptional regulator [Mycobacterium sp.]